MLVAKNNSLRRVILGLDLDPETSSKDRQLIDDISCPICGTPVVYNHSEGDNLFNYFTHTDSSPDCFESAGTSDEHRLAVEVTVKELFNRIHEVTGESIEIDVEKWVGEQPNFVITDIRISRPLKIAVEVYYKIDSIGLQRRLDKIFDNDYRAYLIFHSTGRHNADRVESHLNEITPLQVGRFDRDTFTVSFGDLFTEERIDLSNLTTSRLPEYIVW